MTLMIELASELHAYHLSSNLETCSFVDILLK